MKKIINKGTSVAATLARAGTGLKVMKGVEGFNRPEKLMTIYLKEACPFSRKVREGFTMLDMDANIRPCPIDGTRFRPELKAVGGKEQMPLLVDPNADVKIYESIDILKHIFNKYGPGESKIPFLMKEGFIPTGSSRLATIFRSMPWNGLIQDKGDDVTSAATLIPRKVSSAAHDQTVEHPSLEKPVHLWSYEGSGNSRLVREALDVLEIPYYLHNMAPGSPRRPEFLKLSGKMQFPYLIDENTGVKMFESEEIVQYLYKTYRPQKV